MCGCRYERTRRSHGVAGGQVRDGALYRDDSYSAWEARAASAYLQMVRTRPLTLATSKESGGIMIDFDSGCLALALVVALYMITRGSV